MDMLSKPPRSVPFREQMRQRMLIRAVHIAVRVEYVASSAMQVKFLCLPCESAMITDFEQQELRWDHRKQWFECPRCGLELLQDEADMLVSDCMDTLRSYRTDVTRRGMKRWHWAGFLDRLLRRRPPSLT